MKAHSFLLNRAVWFAAAALGGLRTGVNDAFRSSDRDRGLSGNRDADISGALTEIVAIRVFELANAQSIRHQLLSFDGSIDDVDIRCVLNRQKLAIEAKSHVHAGNKRRFLINERAHQRSVHRGAIAYLPVLTGTGWSQAIVGRLVPVTDVDSWHVNPSLGHHHDPAREFPLRDFEVQYCRVPNAPQPSVICSADELDQTFSAARNLTEKLRRQNFSLGGMDAPRVVAALNQAVPHPPI